MLQFCNSAFPLSDLIEENLVSSSETYRTEHLTSGQLMKLGASLLSSVKGKNTYFQRFKNDFIEDFKKYIELTKFVDVMK